MENDFDLSAVPLEDQDILFGTEAERKALKAAEDKLHLDVLHGFTADTGPVDDSAYGQLLEDLELDTSAHEVAKPTHTERTRNRRQFDHSLLLEEMLGYEPDAAMAAASAPSTKPAPTYEQALKNLARATAKELLHKVYEHPGAYPQFRSNQKMRELEILATGQSDLPTTGDWWQPEDYCRMWNPEFYP